MSLVLLVYLVGIVGNIHNTAALCLGISVGVTILATMSFCIDDAEDALPIAKKAAYVCALSLAVVTFIPSEETSHKLLAAYGIDMVIDSESVGRLAPKSLELLELTVDKHIKELKGE